MNEAINIHLIGEKDHSDRNHSWIKRAKELARRGAVILVREGRIFEATPEEVKNYGIEDPLVIHFAHLLLAYRKAAKILPSIKIIKEMYSKDYLPGYLKQITGILRYYANAIYQFFIEVEQHQFGDVFTCRINTIMDNSEYPETLKKFKDELYAKYKEYFYSSYYDESVGINLSECTNFFLSHKEQWDDFIKVICENLLSEIKESKSIDSSLKNHESLSPERMLTFFNDPYESGYAQEVCGEVRNRLFSINLLKIVELERSQSNQIDIYFVVGAGHVEGLETLLNQSNANLNVHCYDSASPPDLRTDAENRHNVGAHESAAQAAAVCVQDQRNITTMPSSSTRACSDAAIMSSIGINGSHAGVLLSDMSLQSISAEYPDDDKLDQLVKPGKSG